MVNAANVAMLHHPFWKEDLARLEVRLGKSKAFVAIARKLLVVVWHVLTYQSLDRNAEPERLAPALPAWGATFMQTANILSKANHPAGQSTAQYVRQQLDRLEIGAELTVIPWGTKKPPLPLPPSGIKIE